VKKMMMLGGGAVAALVTALLTATAFSQHAAASRPPQFRSVQAPRGAIVKYDGQNYYEGRYIAYAADWSAASGRINLQRGVDYRNVLIIQPGQFPARTTIQWHWPDRTAKTGVYGYNHLAWGYYAGGVPKEQVRSAQVADIAELVTDFDVAVSAERGEFNVLSETFLTLKERDFSTRDVEIGFLTDASPTARRFAGRAKQFGTWVDPGGRAWNVTLHDKYCMFIPVRGAMHRGRIHYGAAMKWLVARDVLTGREWFNGLAIGVEPVSGMGAMDVKRWRVTYR
jgi:hypothetical protein